LIGEAERGELRDAFALQARFCRGLGSPLSAELLDDCVAQFDDRRSAVSQLFDDWQGDVTRDVVPLRLLGGVHALALAGRAPELAGHFPSTGGTLGEPGLCAAFRSVLAANLPELRDWLDRVPQTNEVLRSAGLIGGLLAIADRFGHPLRLRELGAAAGLNLHAPDYRYELGPHRWGDEHAALVLRTEWSGPAPALDAPLMVESRAGCDRNPIDVRDPTARLELQAFFWADQIQRHERLRTAIDGIQNAPPRIDRSEAPAWLEAELDRERPPAVTLVVYHSVFWSYLNPQDQTQIRDALQRAGRAATSDRPLAWLRAEEESPSHSLRLTCWPGGDEQRLANLHPHGAWVHWG
jgi:hypothetical protein